MVSTFIYKFVKVKSLNYETYNLLFTTDGFLFNIKDAKY